MKNTTDLESGSDLFQTILPKSEIGSFEFRKLLRLNEQNGSFVCSLLVELIQRVGHSLESIKSMTQIAQGKFINRTFGDHFQRVINEEIGKVDLAVNCVLNYLRVNETTQKTNTVHTLIEEAIIKHKPLMEGKKVRVFKKFEEGLPETVTPDEHLRYMIDSALKYAMELIPLDGGIGFVTRSLTMGEYGKYIEISAVFDGYRKKRESPETVLKHPGFVKREELDLELRLVEEMVKRNRGKLELGIDTQKGRTSISLKLPVERRKIVYYQPIN